MQQQHALLHARACSLLVALLVGGNGICGILLSQIDVAHGVIYLVKVVLVVLIACHAPESANHLARLSLCQNLCHGYASVELQFVGRVHPCHLAEGLVCLLLMPLRRLNLSEQEIFTRTLLASHLVAYHLAQVLGRLREVARMQVVVA